MNSFSDFPNHYMTSFFLSLQSARTTLAGATWFRSTVFVITSSTDSSAANPAPGRGRRAAICGFIQVPEATTEATWKQPLKTHRAQLHTCVFFLSYLTNGFYKELKREKEEGEWAVTQRCLLLRAAVQLLMMVHQSGAVIGQTHSV